MKTQTQNPINYLALITLIAGLLIASCKKDHTPTPTPVITSTSYLTKIKESVSGVSTELRYDANNRLSELILSDTIATGHMYLTYNSNSKVSKTVYSDNSFTNIITYTYDNNGLLIWERKSADTTYVKYIYDANNRPIKLNHYTHHVPDTISMDTISLYGYTEIIYGNGGNIAKETFYDVSPFSGVRFMYENEFDNHPNPLRILKPFNDWSEEVGSVLSNNNVTKKTFTASGNASITTYTYVYDANGYPTKATANDGAITEYEYINK